MKRSTQMATSGNEQQVTVTHTVPPSDLLHDL